MHGLRRHWLAVLLITAIGVAVAWGWTLTQKPVYEASASAYISAAENTESVAPGAGNAYARSYVASFLDLATWRSVAESAIDELGLTTTPEELIDDITISNPEDTAILKVQARAGSPDDAVALAGAWVRGMQTTIDQVDGNGTVGSAPMNVFLGDPAAAPTSAVYPDVRTALLIGGVLGLGFGLAFALVRTAFDRRIRPGDAVHEKLGIPVVGMLPLTDGVDADGKGGGKSGGKTGRNERFAYEEALRALRTNLQFMDVDNPPRVIVITSPMPSDGKSLTACELARTLAASGAPVILVDGDLRRSKVAKNMGLPGGAGLTDVLAGRASLHDVLQKAPGTASLLVLTAGSIPPNPSEVLGSTRMRALLEDLSSAAMVIVDAPPLLPVTDGAVLTHQADGALLVVRVGKTTYDLAEKALSSLEQVHGRALGVVLNRVPMRGVDASPYAHAYRYEYASEHSERKPERTEESNPPRRRTEDPVPLDVLEPVAGRTAAPPRPGTTTERQMHRRAAKRGANRAAAPDQRPAPAAADAQRAFEELLRGGDGAPTPPSHT